MNLDEAIYARRAVRGYTAKRVDGPLVRKLLQAAVHAPSAMNAQPWLFAVVQDAALLKRYSDRGKAMVLARGDPKAKRMEDMLRSESFNIFYDAGTLVVIGVAHGGPYTDADCWLAAENLMLAACDAGLGTCCIGFAVPVLNLPEVKAELGFPSEGVVVAPIIVGYPSAAAPPVARAEPKIVSWSR